MPEYNKDFKLLKQKADSGDSLALEKIIEENTPLVRSIVKRFSGRGAEAEDLFQIGCLGLLKAVKNFDLSFDVKFSTYAVPVIMGEIKRFLRDDGIIKVSRSIKELAQKAAAAKESLEKELGTEPTVREIAEKTGVSPEELACALEASARPESIYSTSDNGTSETAAAVLKIASPENMEKNITDKILVEKLLSQYSKRDRCILKWRYFSGKTQTQIAKKLGISQVQVSRIEKKLLLDMREKIMG